MSKDKPRDYGSGSVYQRKSDGRWIGTIEAGYTATGARRRVTVTARTEAEVKRKLRDRRVKIEQDGLALAGGTRVTVKTWAEKWLARTERTSRPMAYKGDRTAVTQWIVPTIGHKRLESLTPEDIRSVTEFCRSKGLQTSSIKRYHGTLLRLLRTAIVDGYGVPSRVLAVDGPDANKTDRAPLALPHALAVLAVAGQLPHGTRWAAALLQGMRQGECLGLTWECIDFARGTIAISWQLQGLPYIDGRNKALGFRVPDDHESRHLLGALHLVRPKSTKSHRLIPLLPWMRDALLAWREIAPASRHGLVWPDVNGEPVRIEHDNEEWKALQGTAEVGHSAGRYYYGHEMRNTTATLLLEAGVDESVRIAILGHSSINTTRVYEYVDVEQARAALTLVAARLQLNS